MNRIFFRPNLSDKYPAKMPPNATPSRKNISAKFFKLILSHTKSHSSVHVCPRPSVESYSQELHFVSCVIFHWIFEEFCKNWRISTTTTTTRLIDLFGLYCKNIFSYRNITFRYITPIDVSNMTVIFGTAKAPPIFNLGIH